MNAIPLSAPNGYVYAYACGRCHNVKASAEILGLRDAPEPDMAERSQHDADACCACTRCGRPWPPDGDDRVDFRSVCDACRPIDDAETAAAQERAKAKHDERLAAVQASLEHALDRDAAVLLLCLMEEISEEHWCASWMSGLEHMLWRVLKGEARLEDVGIMLRAEAVAPSDKDVIKLGRLHEKSGGWWYWSDTMMCALFVPTPEWLGMAGELGP